VTETAAPAFFFAGGRFLCASPLKRAATTVFSWPPPHQSNLGGNVLYSYVKYLLTPTTFCVIVRLTGQSRPTGQFRLIEA
jgi:hypothetical protein